MQHLRPREHDDGDTPRTLMQRLDRAAGAMNSFLLVAAIGLAGLYFASFLALHIPAMPAMQVGAPLAAPGATGGPAAR